MTIVETTADEYDVLFGKDSLCYNTGAFNALNHYKCDQLYYLLFKNTKIRLGIIVGLKGKSLVTPFSAPFGGFSVIDNRLSIRHIEKAVDALTHFCKEKELESLSITIPPLFYNESFLTKVQQVLFQKGFSLQDLYSNYFFHLNQILNNYLTEVLPANGRKNLTIALSKKMSFGAGSTMEDIKTAYAIIKQNRNAKGYLLSMTEEEVLQTARILKVDSFFVEFEKQVIASAIVYHVSKKMVQVIYWGDLPEFASNKTMNYLSYKIFEYYYLKGFKIMDVGTAMLDGKPNYGLCDFKESIGCSIQPKCTFEIQFGA